MRSLTTSALAVMLLFATAVAGVASESEEGSSEEIAADVTARIVSASLAISAPGSTATTAGENRATQSDDASSANSQPAPFVVLWVAIAAIVGSLLVVQMIRVERRWRRRIGRGKESRNVSPP
jgi:cobalamin biosynthesis Mg chelatase CobN